MSYRNGKPMQVKSASTMNWVITGDFRRDRVVHLLTEKKKKNLPIGWLIIVIQLSMYSCNFQVPKGPEDIGLLLNFQKFTIATAVSEGNITVTGTLKDASGNILSGGILDISRSASTSVLNRAPADTKVYADTSGKFSMNIYAGSFSIKVSRSDGTLVGSFALKVINATTTPEVSSGTGVEVTGIAAAPVGSTTGTTGTTGGATSTAPVAFLSIPSGTPTSIAEGASSTIGVIMTGSVTKSYTVTITSSNLSAISVSPASINITPDDFSVSKQILLTANQDVNQATESVKITLSSDGLKQIEFTVSTVDNDIVIRNWATFSDMFDGTIKAEIIGGSWGGETYTSQTLYYAKCSHGQTYLPISNSCSGIGEVLSFCNTADNTCNGGNANSPVSSGTVFNACNGISLAGKTGWRVPTINELRLLINCTDTSELPRNSNSCTSFTNPPIINLFVTRSDGYWSSTSYASNSAFAWAVNWNNGLVVENIKNGLGIVRCVTGP